MVPVDLSCALVYVCLSALICKVLNIVTTCFLQVIRRLEAGQAKHRHRRKQASRQLLPSEHTSWFYLSWAYTNAAAVPSNG